MFDHDTLYELLNSRFEGKLVGESDDSETAETAADGEQVRPAMPENMLCDLLDELDEAIEELASERERSSKELTAIALGYMDGVVSFANGSYADYEDAYVADMRNTDFTSLDDAVDECSAGFDGNRDWGEAAKGYLRQVVESAQVTPSEVDEGACRAQAQGFMYGADTCEDYEWKVVQMPDGSVVVTDEEAVEEFSMRQLAQSGEGSLLDRVFNAFGIDLGEAQEAIERIVGDDEADEADGKAQTGDAL